MLYQQLVEALDPLLGRGINQIGQVVLPDQVATHDHVGIRHTHNGIASSMPKHVAHLNQTGTKIEINVLGVDQVRQYQGVNTGLILWLGIRSKKLEVLSAQPSAHVTVRQDGCACLSKHRVATSMVQVVMSVDHVADGQIGNLANLCEQFFGWVSGYECIHDSDSVRTNDETCIAAGLAAIAADGGVDSVANLFDGEVLCVCAI